jgi:hypothetical protein
VSGERDFDERHDRYAQFVIAIGDLCAAAERAGLSVMLTLASGQHVLGIPYVHVAGALDELDETGYARTFRIDAAVVNLDEIVALSIHAPPRPNPF